jgi:protein CMS1
MLIPCSANAVLDTSSWEEPRTLENLPKFLQNFAEPREKLNVPPKDKGSPHTIVVAGAGLRAADVTRFVFFSLWMLSILSLITSRALRSFSSKEGAVTKLFAKHIKIKEAVETCKKTRYVFIMSQFFPAL